MYLTRFLINSKSNNELWERFVNGVSKINFIIAIKTIQRTIIYLEYEFDIDPILLYCMTVTYQVPIS